MLRQPFSLGRWLIIRWAVLSVCVAGLTLRAEAPPEQPQYDAALRAFQTGFYDRAAKDLDEFAAKNPNSTLKADALRIKLYAAAEAAAARGDFPGAALLFGNYARDFGAAELGLESAVRQAETFLQAKDFDHATGVIEQPNGLFSQALKNGKPTAWLFRGLMALAEARRQQNQTAPAQAALEKALPFAMTPVEKWDRIRLLERVLELAKQVPQAVEAATQLEALSQDPALVTRQAESVALLGGLLFQQSQPDRASSVLEKNLTPTTPIEYRRAAAFQLAKWRFGRGEVQKARELLETTLFGLANLPEVAPLRLLLGQVLFQRYRELRGTNAASTESLALLDQSRSQFTQTLTNAPPEGLVGGLQLGLGWCLWESALNAVSKDRMGEAAIAFRAAAATLPMGPEQAVAKLKLADASLWRGEDAEAVTNYMAVVDGYSGIPKVQEELVPMALENAVVAAVRSTNAPAAQKAMEMLLKSERTKTVAGRSALLIGSMLERTGLGQGAKSLYESFLARFPDSSVKPDLELELAVMAVHAEPLSDGVMKIESWLNSYTNHKDLTRAEWEYAWSLARSGKHDAALARFKKLTEEHPSDKSVRAARLWLAEYFFQQQDFVLTAQACLPIVADKTLKDEAWYQAKLYIAESHGKLGNTDNSLAELKELLDDGVLVPVSVLGRAYFVYGDELIDSAAGIATNRLAPWSSALTAFTKLSMLTNSPLVPAALGKMGLCQLQLAGENPLNYKLAQDSFERVLTHPDADIWCRAKASLGLAEVLRKQMESKPAVEAIALRDQAINRCLDVAFGKILRPGEAIPVKLLGEAAQDAGALLEKSGRLSEAAQLYEHAAKEIPANAAFWNERSAAVRRRVEGK